MASTVTRENTIEAAIACATIVAIDVIEKTMDASLRFIDDIGLTTKAPRNANFPYWRNVKKVHGNNPCPCRSGLRSKQCSHLWSDAPPEIPRQFLYPDLRELTLNWKNKAK
jgi:hypothetical protein